MAAAAAAVLAAQAATAAEDIAVDAVLEYCGFILPQHRAAIRADGFNSFKDLMKLNQKDIESLAKGFEAKTVQPGKINFGLRRSAEPTISRQMSTGLETFDVADAASHSTPQ